MVRAVRENWALFTGTLMLMMANGLLVTLLSVRGAALGMSPAAIGLMQAAYPLGALAGCLQTPRLIERIGHVRAFAALASLCSISAIVHLLTVEVAAWAAMRFLAGFCFPGLYVVAESWLNAKAENRSRAAILSIYFVIQTAGASAGQALAGIDDPGGALMFGIASILISLSLLPMMISRTPAPAYSAPDRMSVLRLAGISPMAVLGAMLNGAAQAALYVGVPLYGLAQGLSVAEATRLVVVGTIAGAAAQFPVGWVSDRVDRRLVVGALSTVSVAAAVALGAGLFGTAGALGIALIGASVLPVYSLCVAHANDQIAPSQIVPASGALVLTLNVGVLVGAFAGPFSVGLAGPQGLAALFALLCALTGLVALTRTLRVGPPPETRVAQPIAVHGVQIGGVMHPDALEPDGPAGPGMS